MKGMMTVADVIADVRRVLGGADDETVYSRLNYAVEILATESEWDPLRGYLDIAVDDTGLITLPSQVGTPLTVNVDGKPSQGHNFWFQFHLNGPGSSDFRHTSKFHWFDNLPVSTITSVDETDGSALGCVIEDSDDEDIEFRVYGYDVNGDWIRSEEDGNFVDGFLVPTKFGTHLPNPDAPLVTKIVRVSKPVTAGTVKLYTLDGANAVDVLLGEYFPNDKEPTYRQIQVQYKNTTARVAFRKSVETLSTASDIIPLHSGYAIVLMCKALKKFDEDRIEEGEKYQLKAVQLLNKKQQSLELPGGPSIQMSPENLLADKSDRLE